MKKFQLCVHFTRPKSSLCDLKWTVIFNSAIQRAQHTQEQAQISPYQTFGTTQCRLQTMNLFRIFSISKQQHYLLKIHIAVHVGIFYNRSPSAQSFTVSNPQTEPQHQRMGWKRSASVDAIKLQVAHHLYTHVPVRPTASTHSLFTRLIYQHFTLLNGSMLQKTPTIPPQKTLSPEKMLIFEELGKSSSLSVIILPSVSS